MVKSESRAMVPDSGSTLLGEMHRRGAPNTRMSFFVYLLLGSVNSPMTSIVAWVAANFIEAIWMSTGLELTDFGSDSGM